MLAVAIRGAAGVLAAASVLAATGCGGESAESGGPTVSLRVTQEFGHEIVAEHDSVPLEGHGTVTRLLEGHHDVVPWSAGGWVEAIDGIRAHNEGDVRSSWVLNVNGIEADESPTKYRVHPGDIVQWDHRDWYVLLSVRATVGAFPETFTRGVFGRRFPTTVECADPRAPACARVKRVLRRAGVAVDGSPPGGPLPPENEVQRARVLVGPWERFRDRPWPHRIDRGARYSGVFAKFDENGERIHLLDWDARTVRTVGAGSGLVAAQRPTEEDLLWVVTGVDDEGVERAARALNPDDLRDAFALVVTPDGDEKVPLPRPNPDVPRERETD